MKKITLLFILFLGILNSHAQVLLTNNFDTTLGWTTTTMTNDAGTTVAAWSRKTTGVAPNCSPFSGAGMAKFDSYDVTAGGTGRLTSPIIAFAGLDYRVRFNMYRDSGYSTNADLIKIYVNSTNTLTGATLLETYRRPINLAPVETTEGWHEYIANLPAATTGNQYIIFSGTSAYGNNIYIDQISVEQIPSNDGQLASIGLNSFYTAGQNTIAGVIKNLGSTTINSIDVNWQLDSGSIHTQTVSGLSIANNQSYNFTHQDAWNGTPGQYSIKVWISNINGAGADTNATNDQIIKTIYVVNEIYPKTTVYEEGTGTWCGWCVRGHVGLKDMLHNHQDDTFIGIAVHNNDPMVVTAYDAAIGTFISGYPSGIMNRVHSDVDAGLSALEDAYTKEIARVPLAKVNIQNQNWNPTTRVASFDAVATFALDIPNANFNLAAVIVENGVTGTATGYAQTNYYNSNSIDIIDWEGINWRNLGNPIPAATMVYNHVGRALLGGFGGVQGSIPTSLTYNAPYTYSFSYTLPATQNEVNTELVVLVIDNVSGEIINARAVNLDTTLKANSFTKNDVNVYPNPSTGIVHVDTDEAVNISIIDILGKTVYTANNVTKEKAIDLAHLQKGVYIAKMTGAMGSFSKKLILK